MTDEHPDLLSEAPTGPEKARVDLTLKGLPASRARALLALLGCLEDGMFWVPPPSSFESNSIESAAGWFTRLENYYARGGYAAEVER